MNFPVTVDFDTAFQTLHYFCLTNYSLNIAAPSTPVSTCKVLPKNKLCKMQVSSEELCFKEQTFFKEKPSVQLPSLKVSLLT